MTLRLLIATLLIASIALPSCGGKASHSLPGGSGYDRDPYRDYQYGADRYTYNGTYRDPYADYSYYGYPGAPLVGSSTGNLAPRSASDFLNGQLADFSTVFGGAFTKLHQQLPLGESALDNMGYLVASSNAVREPQPSPDGKPRFGLSLVSGRDTVSFVTYGLYAPNMDQQVASVSVGGGGSFGRSGENGLYIGVRQFGEPRYRWYGPLKAGSRWEAQTQRNSNLGRGTAAYITLAVFHGDEARVDGIRVSVGN